MAFMESQELMYNENEVRRSGPFRYNKRDKIKLKPISSHEREAYKQIKAVNTAELNSYTTQIENLTPPKRNYTKRHDPSCVKCVGVRHSNRHKYE